MPACKCARCKGSLIKDRMYDLPRKIHEFFCLNCGERFWMEAIHHVSDPGPPGPDIRAESHSPAAAAWVAPPHLVPARN